MLMTPLRSQCHTICVVKLLCNFNILLQKLQDLIKILQSDMFFLQIFINTRIFSFTLIVRNLFNYFFCKNLESSLNL